MAELGDIDLTGFVPNAVCGRVGDKKVDGKFVDGLSQIVFEKEGWENLWQNPDTRDQIDVICLRYYKDQVLHRDDGPAVEFPDAPNDSMYIWEGEGLKTAGWNNPAWKEEDPDAKDCLAKKIIMNPQDLTVEEINGIENAEHRRIALERKGIENYVEEAQNKGSCTVIDFGENDIEMTKEALMEISQKRYFVGVCRSTGRRYTIPVSNDCNTIRDARQFMSSGLPMDKCVGAS